MWSCLSQAHLDIQKRSCHAKSIQALIDCRFNYRVSPPAVPCEYIFSKKKRLFHESRTIWLLWLSIFTAFHTCVMRLFWLPTCTKIWHSFLCLPGSNPVRRLFHRLSGILNTNVKWTPSLTNLTTLYQLLIPLLTRMLWWRCCGLMKHCSQSVEKAVHIILLFRHWGFKT